MYYRSYSLLLGSMLGLMTLPACSPELHEAHGKQKEWEYQHVKEQKTLDNNAPETRKPFGCDSRDLANFSCE